MPEKKQARTTQASWALQLQTTENFKLSSQVD